MSAHEPPKNERKPRKKWTCIGNGTYGKVYRLQDSQSCVKEMKRWGIHTKPNESYIEPETVNIREIVLASSIHHPHIIHASRVDVHKQNIRMHMDYKGITLADWVSNAPFLTRAGVFWKIMNQLVHTHIFLQRHGVQQVDCRPTNILIDETTYHITIIDLGLMSLKGVGNHEDLASYPSKTLTIWNRWSQCYGTWVYCPPEVVATHYIHDNTISWNIALVGMFILLGTNPIQDYLPPDADISARHPVLQLFRKNEETWDKGIVLAAKDVATIDMLPWGQEWMQLFYDMTRWDVHKRLPLFSVQGCQYLASQNSYNKNAPTMTMASTALSTSWIGREGAITWMKHMALHMNNVSHLILSIWIMDMYMSMLERMSIKEEAHIKSRLVPLTCMILTHMLFDVHGDKIIKQWMKAADMPLEIETYNQVCSKLWTVIRTCYCHCWTPLPQLAFPYVCTINKEDLAAAICTSFMTFNNEPYTMQDVSVCLTAMIRKM